MTLKIICMYLIYCLKIVSLKGKIENTENQPKKNKFFYFNF